MIPTWSISLRNLAAGSQKESGCGGRKRKKRRRGRG
jgi:hypothetical protein